MQSSVESHRAASIIDVVLYLVGVVGLAGSLTVLWLGMRAVMDIGGACAEGGPFVIQQHCPEGVPLLIVGSVFGLFAFGGLMVAKGAPLGDRFVGLVALAWPALFISLGWNFLEYAFRPPDGSGQIIVGWLIPGVIFVIMGGVPLLGAIGMRDSASTLVGRTRTAPADLEETKPAIDDHFGPSRTPSGDTDLAGGLERLARLHDAGDLSDPEYEDAKRALIAEAARGG